MKTVKNVKNISQDATIVKIKLFEFFNITNKIFENKKKFIKEYKPKILLENKYTKNYMINLL